MVILLEDRYRVIRDGADLAPEVSQGAQGSSRPSPWSWTRERGLPVSENVGSSAKAMNESSKMMLEGRPGVHGRAARVQDVYCPHLAMSLS